jgi:hypothetical protein
MRVLSCICPVDKVEVTLTELYEGGADVKFILPHELTPVYTGLAPIHPMVVTHHRILYSMPED